MDVIVCGVRLLTITWRQDRRKTVLAILLMLAGAAAGPLSALALRWMTDAAVDGRSSPAVTAAAVVACLVIVGTTASHFAHIAYFELSELSQLDLEDQLIALSNGSRGLAHHEDPAFVDRMTVLRQEVHQFRTAFQALLTVMALTIAMSITVVLLARLNPTLVLLPLLALPPLVAGRRAEKFVDRAKLATAADSRVALGLLRLATEAEPAKEVRLFRLQEELLRRHADRWQRVTVRLGRAHLLAAALRSGGQLVFAAAYIGGVLLIVREAVAGRRTVGDVVLAIALAVQVNQQVANTVAVLQDLQRMAGAFRNLAGLRALVDADDGVAADTAPPERLLRGIEFVNVSFSYPGSPAVVLQNVDLLLPAGSSVAVVGENGAGKSSFVKLLCGFYQPTQGKIRIDGTDLRLIDWEAWRSRTTAAFQDFVHFELVSREVVGIGDLPRAGDDAAVRGALDRAQATSVIEGLPDGLDTALGKSYVDGVEPSGGQWQKLALSRAFMRDDPLLIVLDEPASALDPPAENALFEQYAAQARDLSSRTGAITVFVSHRFSTVSMADLIVVIADGRLKEVGSHASLMSAGGLYAELYELQAEAYR